MAVTVETLEKLERKITLSVPVTLIQSEVDTRLKRLARTVKMDGFRPGKVPMNVVAQRYGYSVQYEVLNDKVGEAFAVAANEANLRVAGQPRITEKEGAPEGQVTFDAVFEVFPEVKIADLSDAEVEKLSSEVTDSAIDKTLDILRKQRRSFAQRALDAAAQDGDRVTVDFEGKIDGEPFDGGKAEDFQFLVGEGQMLKEFEEDTPLLCTNTTSAQSPTQRRIDCPGYPGGTSGGPFIDTTTGHLLGVIGGHQQGGDTEDTSYAALLGPALQALYAAVAG